MSRCVKWVSGRQSGNRGLDSIECESELDGYNSPLASEESLLRVAVSMTGNFELYSVGNIHF